MNGLWLLQRKKAGHRRAAMSLTELLVVLAIITILASLYVPVVFKVFVRVKKFLGGM